MKVLVTGAGGYTGSRLVARLCAEGHGVRALVRRPAHAAPLRALGARVVIGDVMNPASLAGIAANVEVVYHLAGTLAGGAGRIERILVEGTRNLVEACRVAGGESGDPRAGGPLRAFIFTGNAVVYGDGGGALLDESSPCRPAFPLGRANVGAERELERAAERGLPVTILRLGAIYGPGRLSSELVRAGRFRIIGDGRNQSSRIHIDDLLAALMALGRAPLPGAPRGPSGRLPLGCPGDPLGVRYCLADEEPCAVGDYFGYLAKLLGVPPPRRIPAWYAAGRGRARAGLARLRGRAGDPRAGDVDASVIGLFTADLRLDGSRLRAALGIKPAFPSYRDGLPAALAAEGALQRAGGAPCFQG